MDSLQLCSAECSSVGWVGPCLKGSKSCGTQAGKGGGVLPSHQLSILTPLPSRCPTIALLSFTGDICGWFLKVQSWTNVKWRRGQLFIYNYIERWIWGNFHLKTDENEIFSKVQNIAVDKMPVHSKILPPLQCLNAIDFPKLAHGRTLHWQDWSTGMQIWEEERCGRNCW